MKSLFEHIHYIIYYTIHRYIYFIFNLPAISAGLCLCIYVCLWVCMREREFYLFPQFMWIFILAENENSEYIHLRLSNRKIKRWSNLDEFQLIDGCVSVFVCASVQFSNYNPHSRIRCYFVLYKSICDAMCSFDCAIAVHSLAFAWHSCLRTRRQHSTEHRRHNGLAYFGTIIFTYGKYLFIERSANRAQ